MSKQNFPLRDAQGKIRPVTLVELQESTYLTILRSEGEIRRVLETKDSTKIEEILDGNIPFPKTVVVVRDSNLEQVVYASNDDENAHLIYYRG